MLLPFAVPPNDDAAFDAACMAAVESLGPLSSSRSLPPRSLPAPPSFSDATTAGLLLYLSQGKSLGRSSSVAASGSSVDSGPGFSMFGVPLVWAEARSLLVRRNLFVGALRDVCASPSSGSIRRGPTLPPLLDQTFACNNCSMKVCRLRCRYSYHAELSVVMF